MVNFYVSESNMKNMKYGDPLTVEKGGKTYQGSILEVSTMVDANTGLFLVKGSIQDAQDLYTGSTVKVTATTQRVENAYGGAAGCGVLSILGSRMFT